MAKNAHSDKVLFRAQIAASYLWQITFSRYESVAKTFGLLHNPKTDPYTLQKMSYFKGLP